MSFYTTLCCAINGLLRWPNSLRIWPNSPRIRFWPVWIFERPKAPSDIWADKTGLGCLICLVAVGMYTFLHNSGQRLEHQLGPKYRKRGPEGERHWKKVVGHQEKRRSLEREKSFLYFVQGHQMKYAHLKTWYFQIVTLWVTIWKDRHREPQNSFLVCSHSHLKRCENNSLRIDVSWRLIFNPPSRPRGII